MADGVGVANTVAVVVTVTVTVTLDDSMLTDLKDSCSLVVCTGEGTFEVTVALDDSLLWDSQDACSLVVCAGEGNSCSNCSPSSSQYKEYFTVQFGWTW